MTWGSRCAFRTDSSPAEDDDMSYDDEYAFDTVIMDKGKSKLKAFEVESESLSPKELEGAMREEAEYVSNIFGADVSVPLCTHSRFGHIACLLTMPLPPSTSSPSNPEITHR